MKVDLRTRRSRVGVRICPCGRRLYVHSPGFWCSCARCRMNWSHESREKGWVFWISSSPRFAGTKNPRRALSKSTCRVTSALGFHAERSSNACPGPPPHRHVVDLQGIDNIKPLQIVSSLSWSQCDHFVFRSSRITSSSFRKLVEETHLLPLVVWVAFSFLVRRW